MPLAILLALGLHALLPQLVSAEASMGVLRSLRWWGIALAIVAQVASYWGAGVTVRQVARMASDRISTARGAALVLAASSVGTVAGGPMGYARATWRWTRRGGMSRDGAALCGWLPAVFNTVVLVSLALAGSIELTLRGIVPRAAIIPVVLLAFLVLGGVTTVVIALRQEASRRRMARMYTRARGALHRRPVDDEAVASAIAHLDATWQSLAGGRWREPLAGAVANCAFDLLTVAFVFVAARTAASPAVLLAGYGLPQVAGRLGLLPGGLGIVEGGMLGAFVATGVPHATAVVVVLGYRLLSFWVPLIVGFGLAARFERVGRKRVRDARR